MSQRHHVHEAGFAAEVDGHTPMVEVAHPAGDGHLTEERVREIVREELARHDGSAHNYYGPNEPGAHARAPQYDPQGKRAPVGSVVAFYRGAALPEGWGPWEHNGTDGPYFIIKLAEMDA